MDEIRSSPGNGLNAISLFAGGGGSSTGYRMAGYRMLYANEFVPAAAETYSANARPGTIVDTTDIREVTGKSILDRIGLGVGELDVLDGSPPCASFSTAGKRSAKWGQVSSYSDTKQRTDDLFYEYARIVRDVQPRVFVAENVSGLVKGVAKGYFKAILQALRDCGYTVSARLLDASWLGVPQARQRLIFVGTRNDLGLVPSHPRPWAYRYTLRDALPWLTHQGNADREEPGLMSADRPSSTMGTGWAFPSGYAPPSVVATQQPRIIHDTSGDRGLGDITDGPSPTITVGMGSVNSYHFQVIDPRMEGKDSFDPETGQKLTMVPKNLTAAYPELMLRRLTLGELRAICSFPPDYVLTGSYAQRWERMGRSVPPLMMKAIADHVAMNILGAEVTSSAV